jgi:AcrR family transcriptional regulator
VTCNDRNISVRKRQLLDGTLRYLLDNGIANLSLRPLATELETSPRILMFHFKSKEGLLQEVLAELHTRVVASLQAMHAERSPKQIALLERFWDWATSKKNLPLLRLLYETQIVALQNPAEYGRYLKDISTDWQAVAFETLAAPHQTEAIATLCIAVFDGLFLELMATGERARLTRALKEFIRIVRVATPAP